MGEEIKRKTESEVGQVDKISFVTPLEEEYPEKLRNIPDAPAGLYVRGRLPADPDITVAIIGARDCSDYGRHVARELGACMGRHGITVISGMARGIDGIGQWAALEAGGMSIGVLGCGVDICYPAGNRSLFDRLPEQGAVISEYPPGTPPRPMNFPARNRIVSGLADVVVVVEARSKSGTLITVDMALEQGREVFVVPGRVTDRLSDGCNRLIKQGAGILTSPEELLEELWELKERNGKHRAGQPAKGEAFRKEYCKERVQRQQEQETESAEVQPEFQSVYQALDFYPQSVEQIMAHLPYDITLTQAMIQLIRLCMDNKAVQVSPGYFKAVKQ